MSAAVVVGPPEPAEVVAPESTAAAVPEPSASGRPHPRTPAPEPRVEPSEATTPRPEVVSPTPPTPALSPGAAAFAEGRRLFLANDVEGAIARFEAAARLMPRDAEVQRQLGRAHMRAGSVSSSVAAYRRYLELSPRYWAGTRARLDASELGREVGPLTVPAPLAPEEQPSPC